MSPRSRRVALATSLALLLAGVSVAALASSGGAGSKKASAAPGPDPASSAVHGSLSHRFATLSAAHSNSCGLQATQVMALSKHARLQGSCCDPMDMTSYRQQLHRLRKYASMRHLVPSDPYDVDVALAQRLLGYRSIALTPVEAAAYKTAVHRSETHGPCCCPCWRWQAFKGQAHYLLHRRHFSGTQVGRLWGLEEGCGGPPTSKT